MRLPALVQGARHAQRQRHGGLALQRQVSQHVLHQGLLVQLGTKGRTVGAVVQRLRHRHAHPGA